MTSVAGGAVVLTLLSACAPSSPPPAVAIQATSQSVVSRVDTTNNVGLAPSIALDSSGNPAVAYLLYPQVPVKGAIPIAVVPGQPQPPAVLLATEQAGTWLRRSVTAQKTAPAEGDAPGLADSQGQPVAGVGTSVAVDQQNNEHVAWGTPKGLFYGVSSQGVFGTPEKVAGSGVGASVRVGTTGVPYISFYLGASLKVASKAGSSWTVDDVTDLVGVPSAPARTTSLQLAASGPVVAYGDQQQTFVAMKGAAGWTTQGIPGDGGFAVSLALDTDGNPFVSYMDSAGAVHEAQASGGGWKVTDVGSAGAPQAGNQSDARWGTGIAVDDQGTVRVAWANLAADEIELSTSTNGAFQTLAIPESAGGQMPALAVTPDAKRVLIAWYSSTDGDLEVAQPAAGPPALAYSPPAVPSGSPSATSSGPACQPQGSSTDLTIESSSAAGFSVQCLAVAADTSFTVTLDNTDTSIIHNWALYPDQATAESGGQAIGGATSASDVVQPGASTAYKLDALSAGTYFYHCDIHPTTMTGTLEVVGK